jgi:hypothetical protein
VNPKHCIDVKIPKNVEAPAAGSFQGVNTFISLTFEQDCTLTSIAPVAFHSCLIRARIAAAPRVVVREAHDFISKKTLVEH